jgi:peroxiredoxin (alkyl hydroperoxide reductase subunit C)
VGVLGAGAAVPPFELARADGSKFTDRDLLSSRAVLVFYPFAFSPVCTDQLQLYEPLRRELAGRGIELYGVSCDATFSQSAFREKLGIDGEQLSDFEPKGAACRAFGVLHEGGFPQRALVITAPDGTIRWSFQADSPGELPPLELLREGLEEAFPEGAPD